MPFRHTTSTASRSGRPPTAGDSCARGALPPAPFLTDCWRGPRPGTSGNPHCNARTANRWWPTRSMAMFSTGCMSTRPREKATASRVVLGKCAWRGGARPARRAAASPSVRPLRRMPAPRSRGPYRARRLPRCLRPRDRLARRQRRGVRRDAHQPGVHGTAAVRGDHRAFGQRGLPEVHPLAREVPVPRAVTDGHSADALVSRAGTGAAVVSRRRRRQGAHRMRNGLKAARSGAATLPRCACTA